MSATQGLITDTITFSNVDGPGNRFVLFLQGCNFDCIACHNPYTINRCNHCGDCVSACPSGALGLSLEGGVEWNRDSCQGTDNCIAVCPWDSTPKATRMSVDDLLVEIRRAAPFLSGITVSGGEATQQADFLRALFGTIKADPSLADLTCFIDSNGAADRSTWTSLLLVMDGAMIDLKCLDPEIHRSITGQPNDQVLESIRYLDAVDRLYEVRLLMLPGINDHPALLERTALWLADIDPLMRIKLIGFRRHGVRPSTRHLVEPTPAQMFEYHDIFAKAAPFSLCVI
ncbi:MAG: YjjW family glycine radical enzyme activase [Ilumatobacteraceae bacterium]